MSHHYSSLTLNEFQWSDVRNKEKKTTLQIGNYDKHQFVILTLDCRLRFKKQTYTIKIGTGMKKRANAHNSQAARTKPMNATPWRHMQTLGVIGVCFVNSTYVFTGSNTKLAIKREFRYYSHTRTRARTHKACSAHTNPSFLSLLGRQFNYG